MALLKHAQTEFSFHRKYGYLSSCPTNLGTGMRASVHMHIPNSLTETQFENTCCQLGLEVRGRHGEKRGGDGGVYDVSNFQRLGRTEVELVQTLVDGINSI
ncbi:putative arginine kinase ZC434.8 [Branchiostoma floridae x Branchiostoma japonicum]